MKDEDREEFLDNFTNSSTDGLIGFAVMGGVFGEGIDLNPEEWEHVIRLKNENSLKNTIKEFWKDHNK